MWWGRWHNIKIAHLYASPPDNFECVQTTRLPWPATEGIRWRKTDIKDLWPASLVELFENDERVRTSPTKAKRTRSARGDDGVEKESTVAIRTVGAGRRERGNRKSRRTVSEGVTETGAPTDVEPPGGTRSVDPMPARGRADSGPPKAPVTSKESPIDVDGEQDVEMGPVQQRDADGGAKTPGQPRGGGRFQGRPRGLMTWRTRPRTTAGLGAKHLATLARRAAGGAGKR